MFLGVNNKVEELAKAKLERPKRLRQLAAREWREIDDGTLVWERPAAEVAALRTLSKADLLAFYHVWDGWASCGLAWLCARTLLPVLQLPGTGLSLAVQVAKLHKPTRPRDTSGHIVLTAIPLPGAGGRP